MVDPNLIAGTALVRAASGTTTDGASEATRLFWQDVAHILRWHAVAAGVAVAATPIVYQLSRVAAQRYRAELVNAAKDAVQREELFNGEEADGVMIDPADEGGITISYNTLSGAKRQRQQQQQKQRRVQKGGGDGGSFVPAQEGDSLNSSGSGDNSSAGGGSFSVHYASASSTFAMRVGRHHSWAVSSFAHQVLAAQRAPNMQFVRTCSRAAACQYCVVVLRVCATSCVLCVASLSVTHACCNMLDRAIPIVNKNEENVLSTVAAGEGRMSVKSVARHFFCAPLFSSAAPPSPSVGCCYGLYDFSVSACGVWSRLIPRFAVVQSLYQRLFGRLQPLHTEWRDDICRSGGTSAAAADASASASTTTVHARADAVWAALTPRGYFVVTLLPRLPWRVLAGLRWASRRASNAVARRWYDAVPSTAISAPQRRRSTSSNNDVDNNNSDGCGKSSSTKPKQHKKLIHVPLVRVATLFASDLVFAGLVFVATLFVSSGDGSGGPRPLVHNAAGASYDMFCWVEAASSVVSLVL